MELGELQAHKVATKLAFTVACVA